MRKAAPRILHATLRTQNSRRVGEANVNGQPASRSFPARVRFNVSCALLESNASTHASIRLDAGVGLCICGQIAAGISHATRRMQNAARQFAGIVTTGAFAVSVTSPSAIKFCTTVNAYFESKSARSIQ